MSRYTDAFKEEMSGYNLVARGVLSLHELLNIATLEHISKLNECLYIRDELESPK